MQKIVNIYPTITTMKNWREKIIEADELGLTEVCFFPTSLTPLERKEAWQMLESTSIKYIPLVHLRHDTEIFEIEYYIRRFGTKFFNIHSQENGDFKQKNDLSKYKQIICIENTLSPISDNELDNWAGLCLDASHMESMKLKNNPVHKLWLKMLKKHFPKVAHLSATRKESGNTDHYSFHVMKKLTDYNYVKRYNEYLPEICAIEIENSISEQLEIKKYLEKILF
jgi:hypothetical protein